MIYTRWGIPVQVIGNCGQQKPRYLMTPDTLLKVKFLEGEPEESYRFVFTLKADDGWPEITKAIEDAPRLTLKGRELQAAFKQAR